MGKGKKTIRQNDDAPDALSEVLDGGGAKSPRPPAGKNGAKRCAACGREFGPGEMTFRKDGALVCSECTDEGIQCRHCGCRHYYKTTDTRPMPGGWVRRKRVCRNCGAVIFTKETSE